MNPLTESWLELPLDASLEQWRQLDNAASADLAAIRTLDSSDPWFDQLSTEITSRLLSRHTPGSQELMRFRQKLPHIGFHLQQIHDDFNPLLAELLQSVSQLHEGSYHLVLTALQKILRRWSDHSSVGADFTAPSQVLQLLESIDAIMAPGLATVDQSQLAVYQQQKKLIRDLTDDTLMDRGSAEFAEHMNLFRRELVLNRLLFEWHEPDIDRYLQMPIRGTIVSDTAGCYALGLRPGPLPQEPITQGQFEACLQALATWAVERSAQVELVGDEKGPFQIEQLTRELTLLPWQRNRYWAGYVDSELQRQCNIDDSEVVNPLEWAIAVRSWVWFADRWPGYYMSRDRRPMLDTLRASGQRLIEFISSMRACRNASQQQAVQLMLTR